MLISHRYFYPDGAHPLYDDRDYLYLDIETTGLSRDKSILYMIGCGFRERDRDDLHVILWFNEDGRNEKDILISFSDFLTLKDWTAVTFNGDRFDLPYLKARYAFHELNCPLLSLDSLDLYRLLKPYKSLFKLDKARQKDWESALGIARQDAMSGRELIGVYRSFLQEHDEKLFQLLVLHNYEDVCHLSQLAVLLGLEEILAGGFVIEDMEFVEEAGAEDSSPGARLLVRCQIKSPFQLVGDTFTIMKELAEGSIRIVGNQIECSIYSETKIMKHFFPDPENYYYLPREDRAIHKSVGIYVDREYRERCSPRQCYAQKEGYFLPLYKVVDNRSADRAGHDKECIDDLTLYHPEYKSQPSYIEYADLASADDSTRQLWMRGILSHFLL